MEKDGGDGYAVGIRERLMEKARMCREIERKGIVPRKGRMGRGLFPAEEEEMGMCITYERKMGWDL